MEISGLSVYQNPQAFAEELIRRVNEAVLAGEKGKFRGEFTYWTHHVKNWLVNKGKELGYRPICTMEGEREFMLDLVWYKEGPGGSAVLGCESEWGSTRDYRNNHWRVAEDFDKLLNFKAPLKLLIFDSYSNLPESERKLNQGRILEEITRYLKDYGDHRVKEKYIVIDFWKHSEAWLCEIQKDGTDDTLAFKPLVLSL